MKLNKLKVENYKCIHDTTEFQLGDITCLVGKNEAGKSAILEAIYKLGPVEEGQANFVPIDHYPRMHYAVYKDEHDENPANVLTLTCELEPPDIEAVSQAIGVDPFNPSQAERADSQIAITIRKGYDNVRQITADIDERRIVDHLVTQVNFNAAEAQQVGQVETIDALRVKLNEIADRTEKQNTLLASVTGKFGDGSASTTIEKVLGDRLPTFVLFSLYHRLAGRVSVNRLREKQNGEHGGLDTEDRVFLALLDLANSDIDQLENLGTSEHVIAELEAIGNRLTDEIRAYWSTNRSIDVEFRFDPGRPGDEPPFNSGHVFSTRIKNLRHRVTVPFDDRSAGFRWFFSFLVWFSQVKKNYGKNLVLLLDEPGLTLHGKAQADLVQYINDKLKPAHQVIYTSHSPFMIDPENILAIRTVEDREEQDGTVVGTKVGDKVLAIDRDTILPLQAALGYDITQTLFVGPHTLVVEGPSDFLYLKWFSSELHAKGRNSLDARWSISPIGSITKIGSFVVLVYGKTKNIAVLTDYATGEKAEVRRLRESELLKDGHVLTNENYAGQSEADIEDVIGRETYISLVNRCYGLEDAVTLPADKPEGAPHRVVKEVENHFRLQPEIPEFDHTEPARYLMEHGADLKDVLPGLEQALERFEALITDFNSLLADEA